MTVIAWDGRTLAADKRAVNAGHKSTTTKIRRTASGDLIGASGDQDVATALMAWYERGADESKFPANRNNDGYPRAYLLVVQRSRVMRFECEPHPLLVEDPFYAMGSGRDYALAAMHLGYSAAEAVEVACALDTGCGNGMDALEFEDAP